MEEEETTTALQDWQFGYAASTLFAYSMDMLDERPPHFSGTNVEKWAVFSSSQAACTIINDWTRASKMLFRETERLVAKVPLYKEYYDRAVSEFETFASRISTQTKEREQLNLHCGLRIHCFVNESRIVDSEIRKINEFVASVKIAQACLLAMPVEQVFQMDQSQNANALARFLNPQP